jgi:hypothetical protein
MELETKRHFERHRHRWENNNKLGLKKWGLNWLIGLVCLRIGITGCLVNTLMNWIFHKCGKYLAYLPKTKTKLHGLSPRTNYTDRATAACRRSDYQLLRIEGDTWSA